MSRHLQRDLDQIKKNLLQLGSLVETAIKNALIAFNECRPELAQNVIAEEKQIDEREVLIEEACLKIDHSVASINLRIDFFGKTLPAK